MIVLVVLRNLSRPAAIIDVVDNLGEVSRAEELSRLCSAVVSVDDAAEPVALRLVVIAIQSKLVIS